MHFVGLTTGKGLVYLVLLGQLADNQAGGYCLGWLFLAPSTAMQRLQQSNYDPHEGSPTRVA